MAKKLLLIGGGFVSLFALAILYWNWSAAREWRRLKAGLEAKGESFDLQRLLPPAPPPQENFGAIEPLKDIVIADPSDEAKLLAAFPDTSLRLDSEDRIKLTLRSGLERGEAADLDALARRLREESRLPLPVDSGNAARDLLVAIDKACPLILELCQSVNRPNSQFTPPLATREWAKPLIAQRHPHFEVSNKAARLLKLRATAAARAGDGAAAADSLLIMMKLAEALAQEPGLLAHLIYLTIESEVHAALWEGLHRRVFSQNQLQRLQSALAKYDGQKTLLFALRTEVIEEVDALYDLKSSRRNPGFRGLNGEPAFIIGCAPNGWFDQNAIDFVSVRWDYQIEPLKTSGLQAAVTKTAALTPMLCARDPARLGFLFSDFVLGSASPVIDRAAFEQSCNDLALTATALERFFLMHNGYPETLDELVPSILTTAPVDHLSNRPILYQLASNGRYKLWAVGFDGIDDGGNVMSDHFGEIGSNLRQSRYKGDWVWQYTPVKP